MKNQSKVRCRTFQLRFARSWSDDAEDADDEDLPEPEPADLGGKLRVGSEKVGKRGLAAVVIMEGLRPSAVRSVSRGASQ